MTDFRRFWFEFGEATISATGSRVEALSLNQAGGGRHGGGIIHVCQPGIRIDQP
jgi:hypothetical protein